MAWWDKLGQGRLVSRATGVLPQTASTNIFTISGGRILLAAILGQVTTIIGAVANSTHFRHTPTGGAAIDLCAAGLDINGDAVGMNYGISGMPTDTLMKALGLIPAPTQALILVSGIISLRCLGSDGGGGLVSWDILYIPVDAGASVIAA